MRYDVLGEKDLEEVKRIRTQTGCRGVMSARGLLANPVSHLFLGI